MKYLHTIHLSPSFGDTTDTYICCKKSSQGRLQVKLCIFRENTLNACIVFLDFLWLHFHLVIGDIFLSVKLALVSIE